MYNAAMRNLSRFLTVLILLVALASCVDVVSSFRINDDGSGSLSLRYSVSKALLNLGTIDEENRFYALPVSESDFLETTESVDGVELSSFKVDEEVDLYNVEAGITFDGIDSLSSFFGASGPGTVSLTSVGGDSVFTYTVYPGAGAEVDPESAAFIDAFFSDYAAAFSLRAPADVKSVSDGSFSGRDAEVEYPTADVLKSVDPVIWEVRW